MRIEALETVRTPLQPNLCFVRLRTDDGRVGLGEAFYGSTTVETYLHDQVAPEIIAIADPTPEAMAARLRPYTGYQGGGAETRGNGAVDEALWDLLGQAAGLPLADLLGGTVRDSIEIYNTCAGPGYVRDGHRQESRNWGLDTGRFEDLNAFLTRPADLARELLAEGIRGMKIWPFDRAAERSGGQDITSGELAGGLALVEQIRDAVGHDMRIMIELHGLWAPRPASTICRALEPYEPAWVEDPVRPDGSDALAALRAATRVPIATGETVTGCRRVSPD